MNTPNLLWWKTSVAVLCLWAVVLVAVAYLRFGGVHGHVRLAGVHTAAFTVPADIAPPAPSHSGSGPLLEASQVVYRGAFRLPAESVNGSSFAYGGTGLAFNPARNSLFVVGHDWHQMVAEIAVPEIRASSSLDSLATATLLQPFADVTEGKLGKLGAAEMKIGGLLPYDGKLYASGYVYYDAAKTQVQSHIVSGTDLGITGDVGGPYTVGAVGPGFIAGYFGIVPAAWRDALGGPVLNGNCCLPIITRTSYGPALFSIDPKLFGSTNPVPATPLVYYPSDHHTLGDWDETTQFFGAAAVNGVVFPEGSRSVLFFGWKGMGRWCYGIPGENCPADPAARYKGVHAPPYSYYVWAYDANDLAAVKRGEKRPWDVKPYLAWSLSLPFADARAYILGAAYDPLRNRIFLTQAFGDGDRPLVHVYAVRVE